MVYEEVIIERTLDSIVEIYNANMGDVIIELEYNKKYQYIKYLFNTYGFDFIDAVIDICILYKLESPYAFFKAVTENFIAQGATTREAVKNARRMRKGRFNSSGRNYDYDDLEKRLLGWH